MEKITSFNKENLKLLSADIDETLKAVNKKHGINLHVGNISYTNKTSLQLTNTDEARKNFRLYCKMYGLDETDLTETEIKEAIAQIGENLSRVQYSDSNDGEPQYYRDVYLKDWQVHNRPKNLNE